MMESVKVGFMYIDVFRSFMNGNVQVVYGVLSFGFGCEV